MSERLTISAFARAAGCDEKQVRRAVEKGLLHKDGKGLLAATDVESGWRRPNRRTITKLASDNLASSAQTPDKVPAPIDPRSVRDETPEEGAERIVRSSTLLSIDKAMELKENYLGRLKELEYDLKSGAVVPANEVLKLVGTEYAKVRTRLLAIPAERAPAIHRLKTIVEVKDLLQSVITEALEELTQDGPRG